jgi:hypothetical protein
MLSTWDSASHDSRRQMFLYPLNFCVTGNPETDYVFNEITLETNVSTEIEYKR